MSIQIQEASTRMVFLILLSPSSFETWANAVLSLNYQFWHLSQSPLPSPKSFRPWAHILHLKTSSPRLSSNSPSPHAAQVLSLLISPYALLCPVTPHGQHKLGTVYPVMCAELHLLLFISLSAPLFLYLAVRLPFPLPVPTFSNSRCVVTNSVMSCS